MVKSHVHLFHIIYLNGLVMHLLKRVTGVKTSEHNLENLVSNILRSGLELFESGYLIHLTCSLEKLLISEDSTKCHSVRGSCINKVCNGIMGVVQHFLNIFQFKEDHELEETI